MVIILLNINICLSIWCHMCVSQHCSLLSVSCPFPPPLSLSLSLFPLYFLFISSLFPLHFLTIRMQMSLTWSMWHCMQMHWISCTISCNSSSTPSIQHGILGLLMLPARPLKYSWMHVLQRYIKWQRSYNWWLSVFLTISLLLRSAHYPTADQYSTDSSILPLTWKRKSGSKVIVLVLAGRCWFNTSIPRSCHCSGLVVLSVIPRCTESFKWSYS